jgi:hypothetical protein
MSSEKNIVCEGGLLPFKSRFEKVKYTFMSSPDQILVWCVVSVTALYCTWFAAIYSERQGKITTMQSLY